MVTQLLRKGWYRPVHAKESSDSQAVHSLLAGRNLHAKSFDVELGIRGILRGCWLKVGEVSCRRFEPPFVSSPEDVK